jgi:hypothetical protein
VVWAPRALEEIVRPRRLAGVGARPLNFTVRRPERRAVPFSGFLKGQCGYITYEEGSRQLQIYWEFGIEGPCIGSIPYEWSDPSEPQLTERQQLEILAALRTWLRNQNIPSTLDEPWLGDLADEAGSKCIWASCNNPRAQGYYICKEHWMRAFVLGHCARPPNNRWRGP